MTTKKFPWGELMQFGLGTLRLTPTEFWRSTLRELRAAVSSSFQPPLLRQNLDDLMKDYPD
jgi:uncharacterized phage protein (TIGR02216 family)